MAESRGLGDVYKRQDEYNEFVLKNHGENESESENRSSFFEEYEKNFYSGKNEEDDSK